MEFEPRLPREVSREGFVADVVRVVEAEFDHPVALLGQSMRAHNAMLVATTRPDSVRQLVLLEGDAGSGTPEDHHKLGDFVRSRPGPFRDREAAAKFLGDGPLAAAWATDLEQHDDGMFTRAQKTEFTRRGHAVSRTDLPGGSPDAHLDATDSWIRVLKDFLEPDPARAR